MLKILGIGNSYTETDAAVIAEAVRDAIATPYAVTAATIN